MILLIDNYDSFTYNIVQYLGEFSAKTKVVRNNEITISEISTLNPQKIIISPGPCSPKDAGISIETIQEFYKKIPILGVCLGHQAIGEAFGGKIIKAPTPIHGKTSSISHTNKGIFKNIPNNFLATRYHSLVISKEEFPQELEITAQTDDNVIMGIQHKHYPIFGVQFHPESIATEYGKELLKNFLNSECFKFITIFCGFCFLFFLLVLTYTNSDKCLIDPARV